jgi:hypothetical protein
MGVTVDVEPEVLSVGMGVTVDVEPEVLSLSLLHPEAANTNPRQTTTKRACCLGGLFAFLMIRPLVRGFIGQLR